jgi:ATP-dependent DNA ligase
MAVAALSARWCLIDGEAIVCDDSGLAVFELIRRQRTSATASTVLSTCSHWTVKICGGSRSSP